jgi:hypothetical protein
MQSTTSKEKTMKQSAAAKLVKLAEKPIPTSTGGRYNRRKSLRALFAEAVAETEAKIRSESGARCGTCGRICDPWNNSDEGYSHCCNDRIEYDGEWQNDAEGINHWAVDSVAWRLSSDVRNIVLP